MKRHLSFADLIGEPTSTRVLVDSPVKPANDKESIQSAGPVWPPV